MRIEDWSLHGHTQQLQGRVFGHPLFDFGEQITTSDIVHINGHTVFTRSGSQYFLGAPSVEYVEWCHEIGCHVPTSEEPIKLS